MHQTTLKDKREVEAQNVVTDELVAVRIEVLHVLKKCQQRLLFILFKTIFVNSEDMFAGSLLNPKIQTRHRSFVNCNRQDPTGSRTKRTQLVTPLLFHRNIFEISL